MAHRVAVVGAGLMGSGIAQVAAQADGTWCCVTSPTTRSSEGSPASRRAPRRLVEKDRLSPDDRDAALARITSDPDLDAAAEADIVVEAVFEQLEVKHELFRELDRICRADAVLATNTSAIPITNIASVTTRPESVVGMHFFSPVPVMKLCELVRGYKHRRTRPSRRRARSPSPSARPASSSTATSPGSSRPG